MNVRSQLERAYPAPLVYVLREIGAHADRRRETACLVGGPVRDLLLGREDLDLDVVVEGDAAGLARDLCEPLDATIVRTHDRFGTATVRLGTGRMVDLSMARSESYAGPAALPEVAPASIEEDLARRDFTINTIAIRLGPATFGGITQQGDALADLRAGMIRALHADSFRDDPTRMFRSVRFEQRFGFTVEARTSAWMRDAVERRWAKGLSGARVRQEILSLLRETRAIACLARLREWGLLDSLAVPLTFSDAAEERCAAVGALIDTWGMRRSRRRMCSS